ncbi:hypothetical protein C8046_00025 [Serinibacter arcticus]|uniref:DUF4397 domain-containing protein n=1 Tax=Serinibacter arcticus TaxID=1655435 RepID=A0A2U2A095_9MICO|nr:hypothetical protein C8046_00025 [Serinibacter arcticus]
MPRPPPPPRPPSPPPWTAGCVWVTLPRHPAVDARLTAVAGTTDLTFEDVGYGDVSGYTRLPQGTYTVAMIPAGAPRGTDPHHQTFEVVPGGAATVAAVGLNALSGRVIADDLTPRRRRASVSSRPPSPPRGRRHHRHGDPHRPGRRVRYRDRLRRGRRRSLDARRRGDAVRHGPGGPPRRSVNTLVVLDDGDQITLTTLEDASGPSAAPQGGVATGEVCWRPTAARAAIAGVAGALGLVVGLRALVRRRPEVA